MKYRALLPSEHDDRRIRWAIDYLCHNLHQEVSLKQLAEQIGVSVCYFVHLFKNNTGQSPIPFLKDLRLDRARELLSSTSLPLKEIMSQAGFSASSHFFKDFKRKYGVTPGQIRKGKTIVKEIHPGYRRTGIIGRHAARSAIK